MFWVQSKFRDFGGFGVRRGVKAAGPRATEIASCIRFFYPHFLEKIKISLPTSAAKSLFHVFYLGYPHKLYTIHLGVPCEILQFSGRARPLRGCWRNSYVVIHTPDICKILEGTPSTCPRFRRRCAAVGETPRLSNIPPKIAKFQREPLGKL